MNFLKIKKVSQLKRQGKIFYLLREADTSLIFCQKYLQLKWNSWFSFLSTNEKMIQFPFICWKTFWFPDIISWTISCCRRFERKCVSFVFQKFDTFRFSGNFPSETRYKKHDWRTNSFNIPLKRFCSSLFLYHYYYSALKIKLIGRQPQSRGCATTFALLPMCSEA